MYNKKEIEGIVEKNAFSTKLCESWDNSCLILVPNFKEYSFLFGNGKTRICYAYHQGYWNDYHQNIFREIVFLSTSNEINIQYQFISFCLRITKIDWGEYNEGGHGTIYGYIDIHDFNDHSYSFSFNTNFNKNFYDRPNIDETFIRVDFDINVNKEYFLSSVKLIDFCISFGKIGLIPTVVKIGCIDVIKELLKTKD